MRADTSPRGPVVAGLLPAPSTTNVIDVNSEGLATGARNVIEQQGPTTDERAQQLGLGKDAKPRLTETPELKLQVARDTVQDLRSRIAMHQQAIAEPIKASAQDAAQFGVRSNYAGLTAPELRERVNRVKSLEDKKALTNLALSLETKENTLKTGLKRELLDLTTRHSQATEAVRQLGGPDAVPPMPRADQKTASGAAPAPRAATQVAAAPKTAEPKAQSALPPAPAHIAKELSSKAPLMADFDEQAKATRKAMGVAEDFKGTTVVDDYHESSHEINTALRSGKLGHNEQQFVKEMDGSFKHTLPKDTVIYRGVDQKTFGSLKAGSEISDKAYLSGSSVAAKATYFGGADMNDPIGGVLRIEVPKGHPAIVGNADEHEVILPRNTKLKITGVVRHTTADGKRGVNVITAQVVPAKASLSDKLKEKAAKTKATMTAPVKEEAKAKPAPKAEPKKEAVKPAPKAEPKKEAPKEEPKAAPKEENWEERVSAMSDAELKTNLRNHPDLDVNDHMVDGKFDTLSAAEALIEAGPAKPTTAMPEKKKAKVKQALKDAKKDGKLNSDKARRNAENYIRDKIIGSIKKWTGRTNVNIIERLETAAAQYDIANDMVTVSLSDLHPGALFHESLHRLIEQGIVPARTLDTMREILGIKGWRRDGVGNVAPKNNAMYNAVVDYMKQTGRDATVGNQHKWFSHDEVLTYAAEMWMDYKEFSPPQSKVAKIFENLKRMFVEIRNTLFGTDYKTLHEFFRAIDHGRYAARGKESSFVSQMESSGVVGSEKRRLADGGHEVITTVYNGVEGSYRYRVDTYNAKDEHVKTEYKDIKNLDLLTGTLKSDKRRLPDGGHEVTTTVYNGVTGEYRYKVNIYNAKNEFVKTEYRDIKNLDMLTGETKLNSDKKKPGTGLTKLQQALKGDVKSAKGKQFVEADGLEGGHGEPRLQDMGVKGEKALRDAGLLEGTRAAPEWTEKYTPEEAARVLQDAGYTVYDSGVLGDAIKIAAGEDVSFYKDADEADWLGKFDPGQKYVLVSDVLNALNKGGYELRALNNGDSPSLVKTLKEVDVGSLVKSQPDGPGPKLLNSDKGNLSKLKEALQKQAPKSVDEVAKEISGGTLNSDKRKKSFDPMIEAKKAAFLKDSKVKSRVYHATGAIFNEFSGHAAENELIPGFILMNNLGFHFGNRAQANTIAMAKHADVSSGAYDPAQEGVGQHIIPAYIQIKKPLRVKSEDFFQAITGAEHDINEYLEQYPPEIQKIGQDLFKIVEKSDATLEKAAAEVVKYLKDKGYDGIIYHNKYEGEGNSYIVFDSAQAKSATGATEYNRASPNILDSVRPAFDLSTANLANTVKDLFDKVATPSIGHGETLSYFGAAGDRLRHMTQNIPGLRQVSRLMADNLGLNTLLHIRDANPHIKAIADHVRNLMKFDAIKNEWRTEADKVGASMMEMPEKEREGLAKVLLDETIAGEFADPKELSKLSDGTQDMYAKVHAMFKGFADQLRRASLDRINRQFAGMTEDSDRVKAINKAMAEIDEKWKDPAAIRAKEEADKVLAIQNNPTVPNKDKSIAALKARLAKKWSQPVEEMVKGEKIKRAAMIDAHFKEQAQAKANAIAEVNNNFDAMLKKPYFPLSRFGQYTLEYTAKDGQAVFQLFDTAAEREAAVREAKAEGALKLETSMLDKDIFDSGLTMMPIAMIRQMAGELGLSPQALGRVQQMMFKMSNPQSFMKHYVHRKNVKGYTDDMVRSFANYFNVGSSFIARARMSDILQQDIKNVRESKTEGDTTVLTEIANTLTTRLQNTMRPGEEWGAIKQGGFLISLAAVPKAALVNFSGLVMIGLPYLSAHYGAGNAGKGMMSAIKDINWADVLKGKKVDVRGMSPELAQAMAQAEKAGIISQSQISELGSLSTGSKWHFKQIAGVPLGKVMNSLGKMFSTVEEINRHVMFATVFNMEKAQGKSNQEAYEQSIAVVQKTMFEYSRWNRPDILRGGIKGTVFQFKNFMVQYMKLLLAPLGKGGDPKDRLASIYMMSALFVGAGLLGLPGAEDLLDVLDSVMSSENVKFDSRARGRKVLADMFGADLADIMLHGATRATPFDLAGSFSSGRLIPGVEAMFSKNKETADDFYAALGTALGPVAGWAANTMGAIASDNPDTWKRLDKVLPNFLKHPAEATRFGVRGKETDNSGRTIKDSFNPAEVVGKALGFQPTDLSQKRELIWELTKEDKSFMQRRTVLLNNLGYAMVNGGAGAQEAIAKIGKYNTEVAASGHAEYAIDGGSLNRSITSHIKGQNQIVPKRQMPHLRQRMAELE